MKMPSIKPVTHNPKPSRGFTLIETLVAISVLLIALAGPLTIAVKGLTTADYSRDQVTAFYLAQEGIEYIRNLRDTRAIITGHLSDPSTAGHWDGDFALCIAGACKLDTHLASSNLVACDPTVTNTNDPKSCQVYYYSDTDLYGYDTSDTTGVPSKFTRYITIKAIPGEVIPSGVDQGHPYEYKITSTVSWTSTIPNKPIVLSEDIFDWQ